MKKLTLKTARAELMKLRDKATDDLDIAEINAFLQIKNIRKKRLK